MGARSSRPCPGRSRCPAALAILVWMGIGRGVRVERERQGGAQCVRAPAGVSLYALQSAVISPFGTLVFVPPTRASHHRLGARPAVSLAPLLGCLPVLPALLAPHLPRRTGGFLRDRELGAAAGGTVWRGGGRDSVARRRGRTAWRGEGRDSVARQREGQRGGRRDGQRGATLSVHPRSLAGSLAGSPRVAQFRSEL